MKLYLIIAAALSLPLLVVSCKTGSKADEPSAPKSLSSRFEDIAERVAKVSDKDRESLDKEFKGLMEEYQMSNHAIVEAIKEYCKKSECKSDIFEGFGIDKMVSDIEWLCEKCLGEDDDEEEFEGEENEEYEAFDDEDDEVSDLDDEYEDFDAQIERAQKEAQKEIERAQKEAERAQKEAQRELESMLEGYSL